MISAPGPRAPRCKGRRGLGVAARRRICRRPGRFAAIIPTARSEWLEKTEWRSRLAHHDRPI
jgi:hypothetical protein